MPRTRLAEWSRAPSGGNDGCSRLAGPGFSDGVDRSGTGRRACARPGGAPEASPRGRAALAPSGSSRSPVARASRECAGSRTAAAGRPPLSSTSELRHRPAACRDSASRSDRPGSCTPLARCADPAHPRGPPRHRPPLYTGRARFFFGDILRGWRAWLRRAASSACRAPLPAPPAAAHPKPRARHSAPFTC